MAGSTMLASLGRKTETNGIKFQWKIQFPEGVDVSDIKKQCLIAEKILEDDPDQVRMDLEQEE